MGNAKKEPNPINKFTMTVPGPQKYNPMIIEKNMKPQWMFKYYIYIDLGRVLEIQLKSLQRPLCQVQDSMRVMIN